MAEFNLEDWNRASLVFHLMDKKIKFSVCLEVARNCQTMQEAERFMNQECPVCMDSYLMNEVGCTHMPNALEALANTLLILTFQYSIQLPS